MSDPTTVAAPDPTPVVPSVPVAGWRSSEAWLSFFASLPAVILNSPLVTNAPTLVKVVSIIAAAFTIIGYTANRTSLKKAHLAVGGALPAASKIKTAMVATTLVALATFGVGIASCAGTVASIKQGGDAFLQCESQNLAQLVPGSGSGSGSAAGSTVLATVAIDLVSANYEQLIADLIGSLGTQLIGCAVLAVEDVTSAGKTSGAAALTPIEARATALIVKYNWRRSAASTTAPPAAAPVAK